MVGSTASLGTGKYLGPLGWLPLPHSDQAPLETPRLLAEEGDRARLMTRLRRGAVGWKMGKRGPLSGAGQDGRAGGRSPALPLSRGVSLGGRIKSC